MPNSNAGQNIPLAVTGNGTAGVADAGVVTIQGIASGTVVPVSLTSTTITGTVAVTQSTSPWVVSGTVSANCSQTTNPWAVAGNKTNNNAAPSGTNVGVLPGIANAATQSWSEGDQVLESMDLSGRQRVRGTLTNNNAAPAADQLSVMPAIANAAAPSWSEGNQVLESVDLSGNLRTKISSIATSKVPYTITVTVTGGTQNTGTINVGLMEFTSIPTWTTDGSASTTINSVANPQTTGSVTVTSGGVVVGAIQSLGTMGTVTASAGWTIGNQSANQRFDSVYKIQNSVTSYNPSFAVTTTGTAAVGVTGAFKRNTGTPTIVAGQTTNVTGASGFASVTVTPAAVPTVGDLLVLTVGLPSDWSTTTGATYSAVDSFGNTFTVLVSLNVGADPAGVAILYLLSFSSPTSLLTDATGYLGVDLFAVNGVTLGATAVTNFGSAPAAAAVPGVNASVFFGTTVARTNQTTTAAGVLDVNIVGSLGVTNSVSNGTFASITDGTTKVGVISGTTALKTDQSSQAGTAITTVPTAFGTGTPSGNAPGVQAALYVGTTPVRSNQATTATGVVDVNSVGINGTTIVTAASGVQKVGIVGNANATLDAALGTAPTNALGASLFPVTSGGCTTAISQALTSSSQVKNGAGQLYGYAIFNPNASTTTYVFWYNTTSAPTIGSTTNLVYQIGIPGGSAAHVSFDNGIVFSSGIYLAVSTSATSSAAPGTGLTITSVYK